jgi:hypothetical protein
MTFRDFCDSKGIDYELDDSEEGLKLIEEDLYPYTDEIKALFPGFYFKFELN